MFVDVTTRTLVKPQLFTVLVSVVASTVPEKFLGDKRSRRRHA